MPGVEEQVWMQEGVRQVQVGKADSKGGCPAGASTATLEAKVDAFVADYLDEVGSPSGAFLE